MQCVRSSWIAVHKRECYPGPSIVLMAQGEEPTPNINYSNLIKEGHMKTYTVCRFVLGLAHLDRNQSRPGNVAVVA